MKTLLFTCALLSSSIIVLGQYTQSSKAVPRIDTWVDPIPLDLLVKGAQYRAQQQQLYQQQQQQYQQQQEQNRRNAVYAKINEVKNYYNSLTSYPLVTDGWHKVWAISTTEEPFCEVRQVLVKGNKIVGYYKSEGEFDQTHFKVTFSSPIEKNKALISLSYNNEQDSLLDLYFLGD